MAEIVKIKVSSLTEAVGLDNLVVLGVDGTNKSVKVPILLLKGNKGDDGTEIELQKTATHLQWRYIGGSWVNLVALADLKGDKGDTGANIELQKSATHLQWRVSGTATWNDLVALADLKGAKGDTGEGFIIKGYYNTLSALQLAVPTPNAGDAYGVGNTAPFDIYVYDSVSSAWVNNGALQGPAGASSYTYIAYASNAEGADFSLTDGAYIAIKTTTTPIASPVAADFTGLWKQFRFTGTANRVAKSDGTKLVDSAIREVGGKVAFGNDSPLANFDFVGTSVSRGDVYTYRDVASKFLGGGTRIGAVVITLPYRLYDPILQVTIKGFDYFNGAGWEVVVNGYWYPAVNAWYAAKVEVRGSNPFANQVRLGYSGSLPVIVIGGVATPFQDGSLSLTEVLVSYNHKTLYGSGWTITQVTDLTGYTLGTPPTHTYYHSGNLDPALLTFLTSQSTVTTLASLPVTKRVIVASVTAATTLSLAAALEVGRELHLKVYNTSASAITQPLPTSAPFESKKVDGTNISSISIPAGGSVEISILSVTDKYIIKTDA